MRDRQEGSTKGVGESEKFDFEDIRTIRVLRDRRDDARRQHHCAVPLRSRVDPLSPLSATHHRPFLGFDECGMWMEWER